MKTPKKKRKEQKSYGQTAKRGALWSIIRQGGHELIAVPMSVIMARLLTPADFGVAVAASFFILLASRVTQLGFGAAIVRIKELRPEHTSSVFVVSFLLGVANYIVLFLAAPWIGRFFQSAEAGQLVRVAALTFLITPFGSVANALNSRHMQFRYIAIADWTDTLVGAIVTVGLAMRGWGYWSITYGQIVATTIAMGLKMYLAGWRPSLQFSRAAVRELLPYGLGVQTKRALEYVSANADNLVVGRMLDMTALGFYDKAFSTMNRLVNRLTLGQAPFRIFAIIHEDRERFQRAYTRLILSITMIGYPVLVVCIIAASPLFHVLYGAKWASAAVPFQFLCFGGMLKLLNNYASQANEAAGAIWHQARRQAVGTVLVVIGAAVGASRGGILGAAIGVTVAMVLLTVAMQDLVRRATGLTWREMFTPQVPALVCSALVGGAAWGVGALLTRRIPEVRPAIVLASQAGVALICYAAFVLFNRFADLRGVVDETLHEALPASVIRQLNRLGVAVVPEAQS